MIYYTEVRSFTSVKKKKTQVYIQRGRGFQSESIQEEKLKEQKKRKNETDKDLWTRSAVTCQEGREVRSSSPHERRGGKGMIRGKGRSTTLLHQAGGGGASGRSRGLSAAHWESPTDTNTGKEKKLPGSGREWQ